MSRYSSVAGANDEQYRVQQIDRMSQILYKYQTSLLTQSEYQESFEKSIEKTFEELFEELSDLFSESLAEMQRAQKSSPASRQMPTLSLMDRIEKLGGDYDIQQEYSLSNLKETMY